MEKVNCGNRSSWRLYTRIIVLRLILGAKKDCTTQETNEAENVPAECSENISSNLRCVILRNTRGGNSQLNMSYYYVMF